VSREKRAGLRAELHKSLFGLGVYASTQLTWNRSCGSVSEIRSDESRKIATSSTGGRISKCDGVARAVVLSIELPLRQVQTLDALAMLAREPARARRVTAVLLFGAQWRAVSLSTALSVLQRISDKSSSGLGQIEGVPSLC
jgi:hypothetical protein